MRLSEIQFMRKVFTHVIPFILLFMYMIPEPTDSPPVAFADSQISLIDISFSEEYWGHWNREYLIELKGDSYYYGDHKIDPSLIDQFQDSFTDLYESEYYKIGSGEIIVLDYQPRFIVQVTLTDGQVMTVSSLSTFPCFIPWNIMYRGKSYVQYNGKIPSAIMRILICIDGERLGWTDPHQGGLWGCYPAIVPETFTHQDFSSNFPQSANKNPLSEKGEDHLLWTLNLHEYITAIPVCSQNQVFIVTRKKVYSFDIFTGERVWEIPFFNLQSQFRLGKHYAAVHDDMVYVASPDSYVYAMDIKTGEMRWMIDTGLKSPPDLFVYDGNVLMSSDGIIFIDGKTGEEIWELPENRNLKALYSDIIYVSINEGLWNPLFDEFIDIRSGKTLWRMEDTRYRISMYDGNIYMIYRDLEYVVSMDLFSSELWRYQCSSDCSLRHWVLEGTVCIVSDSKSPDLYPYDTVMLFNKDGSLLWKIHYPLNNPEQYPCRVTEVKENGDILFLVVEGGIIHAFQKETGEFLWENEVEGIYLCNFQAKENMIYLVSCDGKIHCLDGETGDIIWQFVAESAFNIWDISDVEVASISFNDGLIVVSQDGNITVISSYPVWTLLHVTATRGGYTAI
ncbi:MAG: PQQ-binding-like beta-propeller repeat protein [Theionarchaea archaeon]|nr:PQQ-binding-like beta-propeller repeat protein [Theionarchaea archaeon]